MVRDFRVAAQAVLTTATALRAAADAIVREPDDVEPEVHVVAHDPDSSLLGADLERACDRLDRRRHGPVPRQGIILTFVSAEPLGLDGWTAGRPDSAYIICAIASLRKRSSRRAARPSSGCCPNANVTRKDAAAIDAFAPPFRAPGWGRILG